LWISAQLSCCHLLEMICPLWNYICGDVTGFCVVCAISACQTLFYKYTGDGEKPRWLSCGGRWLLYRSFRHIVRTVFIVRPALYSGHFPSELSGRGVKLTAKIYVMLWLRMCEALLPLYCVPTQKWTVYVGSTPVFSRLWSCWQVPGYHPDRFLPFLSSLAVPSRLVIVFVTSSLVSTMTLRQRINRNRERI
jgi:hypothetical protein